MTNNLDNFSYNILIANLHEMQNFFSKELNKIYTAKTLEDNFTKILTTMLPIVPHFANECLKILNKNSPKWPDYDEKLLIEDLITFVIQINGKKRFTRETVIGLEQSEIERICKDDFDLNISDFKKIVYIKDKIVNFVG